MIRNDDWIRLISGLTKATSQKNLEWTSDDDRGSVGLNSVYRLTMAIVNAERNVLRASTSNTSYELSANADGLAPYELTVWNKTALSREKIGSISSSTIPSAMATDGVNASLKHLYSVAVQTVEPGEAVVDRLLTDLGVTPE